MPLQKRNLAKSDLLVSQMGLGLMGMSAFYGIDEQNEEESLKTIESALDNGINFFDTADVYGGGENEKLLAKAIKKFGREKFIIATKFGFSIDADGVFSINGKPEYVKASCEASLQRLGIECIDLYYLHRMDPNTPIEETVKAMSELVTEGKVRYLGLSEVSVETLRKASAVHPITALQSEYSLWTLDVEEKILPACRELGIAFIPFSPLGRGFLTGQIKKREDLAENDWRRNTPRFSEENFGKNIELVKEIEKMAVAKGCTPSQLAIAWLVANGDDIFPIPGTKKTKYLLENIGAADIKLTEQDMKEIQKLTSFPAHGER